MSVFFWRRKKDDWLRLLVSLLTVLQSVSAQMPDPPGQAEEGQRAKYGGYLFAHMMDGDSGGLYYEQYPGEAYGLSVAKDLMGPWMQVAGNQRPDWDKFTMPSQVRHGAMLVIDNEQMKTLRKVYSNSEK